MPSPLSGIVIKPIIGAQFVFGGNQHVVRSEFALNLAPACSNIKVYPGTMGVGVAVQLEGEKLDGRNAAAFQAWDIVGAAIVTVPPDSALTFGSNVVCETPGSFDYVSETIGD